MDDNRPFLANSGASGGNLALAARMGAQVAPERPGFLGKSSSLGGLATVIKIGILMRVFKTL
jgi:hypothetical protein